MKTIHIEHHPSAEWLQALGVADWPVWEKEVSVFPWAYDSDETCYMLEGRVIVTPDDGAPVEIVQGDLVTFPEGMSCQWNILQDIRKHYRFS